MLTHYEDKKGDEKCKNWGVWGVRGHPRSSETSPFDRAHMTFYSTLIETIRLSWSLSIIVQIGDNNRTFCYRPSLVVCSGRP